MRSIPSCVLFVAAVIPSWRQECTAFSAGPPSRSAGRTENSPTALLATWSDSKAVRDYQDFLSSGKQEIELAKDGPSVIVRPTDGSTLLADALVQMGRGDDLVVSPGSDIPSSPNLPSEFPIYVSLPPWQLDQFLGELPQSFKDRMEDLVFFSGGLDYGNIEDVLKERGYCRDSMTQVLVSGLHIPPSLRVEDKSVNLGTDANGEKKMAGECAACGKWAGAIAERMEGSNVLCCTDFYREWRRKMWERTVYDAVFHLLGAVREQPTTLADVANYYGDEVSEMVWEMSQLLRGWRAITLMFGFEERIFGIGEMAGTEVSCELKDEMYPFLWGNPVLLESLQFVDYLRFAQSERGLLQSISLPQRADEDYTSKMRQGNLRADGVV